MCVRSHPFPPIQACLVPILSHKALDQPLHDLLASSNECAGNLIAFGLVVNKIAQIVEVRVEAHLTVVDERKAFPLVTKIVKHIVNMMNKEERGEKRDGGGETSV